MYEVGKGGEVPMRFEADEDVENGVLRDAGHDQEHVDNGHVDLNKNVKNENCQNSVKYY